MRIKIALALISAIFMFYWVAFLIVGYILRSMSIIFPFENLIELLSIISFFGSILFLVKARTVLPRWYLAVPLSFSLFVLVIAFLWMNFSGKELLSDHMGIAEALVITLMMLLSPFSALLFLSLFGHPDSVNVYIVVSSVVSILSMFFLFFTLKGLSNAISRGWPTFDAVAAPTLFYWGILMPIIGICFLLSALIYKNPGNVPRYNE